MLVKEPDLQIRQKRKSTKSVSLHTRLPVRKKETFQIWRSLIFGVALLAMAFGAGGLVSLKTQLSQSWSQTFQEFRWLVLVQGNQVQVDEVGGFLKQLDGVKNVKLLSSDVAFLRLKEDPLFADELDNLNSSMIPSSWEIRWKTDPFINQVVLKETISEVEQFPGVLDVVYDESKWQFAQSLKVHWLKARVVLSALIVVGLIWSVVFLGRALFFRPFSFVGWKETGLLVLHDSVWWGLGFALVTHVVGPLGPVFLLGGPLVGMFHAVWRSQPSRS